jgi:signal transduction histidine kinase
LYVLQDTGKPKHFVSGSDIKWSEKDGYKRINAVPVALSPKEEILFYWRMHNDFAGIPKVFSIDLASENILQQEDADYVLGNIKFSFFAGIYLLAAFFNFFFFLNSRERVYLYFSLVIFFHCFYIFPLEETIGREHIIASQYLWLLWIFWPFFFYHFVRHYFQTYQYTPRWDKFLIIMSIITLLGQFFLDYSVAMWKFHDPARLIILTVSMILFLITPFLFIKQKRSAARSFTIAILPFVSILLSGLLLILLKSFWLDWEDTLFQCSWVWAILFLSWGLFKRYDQQKKEIAEKALQVERIEREKEIERSQLIEQQKTELEKQVTERTAELKQSLEELKTTQAQLIQSEKMASLGELTAGIAHEIQNPLNFVNNFSEVSIELADELKDEITKINVNENEKENIEGILNDLVQNQEKINQHGKRADAIVKSMLQHSRVSTGQKELTDINALADEYLRLSYHGLRAKDKTFNATLQTDFDASLQKISIIPQDIGRVLLNLFNNAFYACTERSRSAVTRKKNQTAESYEPTVSVCTKKVDGKIEIHVKDNGNGVPQKVLDKIFQPFFTTKPTGEGTGLGLSLSYDIIKAHGGDIKVISKEGEGAEFVIQLPVNRET